MKLIDTYGAERYYEAEDGTRHIVRAQSHRFTNTISVSLLGSGLMTRVRSLTLEGLDAAMVKANIFDPMDTTIVGQSEPQDVYDEDGAVIGRVIEVWAERGYWPPAPVEPEEVEA